jgi:hypothetical protein
MKNTIDNTESPNILYNETTGHEKQNNPVKKAKSTKKATLSSETNQNNSELKYKTVTSPDGKYAVQVPIFHGNAIYPDTDKLGHHPREGYRRFWAKDQVFARDLQPYLRKGWEFVSGVEPVWAGVRENGEAYYHYLIEIDEYEYEKFEKKKKSLQAQRNNNVYDDVLEPGQYRPQEHQGYSFGHTKP